MSAYPLDFHIKMNTFEKIYSVLAIVFAVILLIALALYPQFREFKNLIIVSLLGLLVNIGLLFIVLRDILTRQFSDQNRKYFWLVLVLLFWPAIIYYLLRYGFLPKTIGNVHNSS